MSPLPTCFLLVILQLPDRPGHRAHSVHKLGVKDNVGVGEHSFLQTHHDKLALSEVLPQHPSDVLCVTQIQSSVHFVQNVHWCRFEQ